MNEQDYQKTVTTIRQAAEAGDVDALIQAYLARYRDLYEMNVTEEWVKQLIEVKTPCGLHDSQNVGHVIGREGLPDGVPTACDEVNPQVIREVWSAYGADSIQASCARHAGIDASCWDHGRGGTVEVVILGPQESVKTAWDLFGKLREATPHEPFVNDVNPACGCHIDDQCCGCGCCKDCVGCFCNE